MQPGRDRDGVRRDHDWLAAVLGVLQILWLNLVTDIFPAMAQVFHAFNARSQTRSAFTSRLFTNGWLWGATLICVLLQLAAVYVPLLQDVLHTVALKAGDWGLILLSSLAPVAVVELVKLAQRH